MSQEQNTTGGIGFCGLLTIVFITLKLFPVWIPLAVILLVCITYIIVSALRNLFI